MSSTNSRKQQQQHQQKNQHRHGRSNKDEMTTNGSVAGAVSTTFREVFPYTSHTQHHSGVTSNHSNNQSPFQQQQQQTQHKIMREVNGDRNRKNNDSVLDALTNDKKGVGSSAGVGVGVGVGVGNSSSGGVEDAVAMVKKRAPSPPPRIYSVPTTDTLGDESQLLMRPYSVQTPTKYRRPIQRSVSARRQQQHHHHHHDHPSSTNKKRTMTPSGSPQRPIAPMTTTQASLMLSSGASQQRHQQQQPGHPSSSTTSSHSTTPTRTRRGGTSVTTKTARKATTPDPSLSALRQTTISDSASGDVAPKTTTNRKSRTPDRSLHRSGTNNNNASDSKRVGSKTPPRASNTTSSNSSNRPRTKVTTVTTTATARGDFQYHEDYMTAKVRPVDVAQRSAFAPNPPVAVSEWMAAMEQLKASASSTNLTGGSSSSLSSSSVRRRMSPSLQHLQLLHKMQSMSVIRQVQFSPSTGLCSDLLATAIAQGETTKASIGGGDTATVATTTTTGGMWGTSLEDRLLQAPRVSHRRDGRYRSIDPVRATERALPAQSSPPLLSNKKARLPMRSDVGFPRATEQEIRRKQKEIAQETEWEMASLRLAILVTSDDLGTAVHQDGEKEESDSGGEDRDVLRGIPFAGRELIIAKERNARHFQRTTDVGTSSGRRTRQWRNPCSMLAPPLDASYSRSQGWRPRPFHDRPPCMEHFLACPLRVQFDTVGDVHPLVCSLALYTLPGKSQINATSTGYTHGKISEEFWFPAGNWKGKVSLEAVKTGDEQIDEQLLEGWFERKHKAIFAYNPLDLKGGFESDSLHLVLQVFKTAYPGATAAHLASGDVAIGSYSSTTSHRRKNSQHQTVNDGEAAAQKATRNFRKFGMQLLTPLCFGICEVSSNGDTMLWPNGEKRDFQFISFPPVPESQESFVDRLAGIVNGSDFGLDVDEVVSGNAGGPSLSETHKKRSVVGRLFRSPSKNSRSRGTSISTASSQMESSVASSRSSYSICGRGMMFLSHLGVDFLQSMLVDHPDLEAKHESRGRVASNGVSSSNNSSDNKTLPKLLVDASGDFAVLLDTQMRPESAYIANDDVKKRSNLMRLPLPPKPASYTGACDVREILYLPSRPDKSYCVDSHPSYRSLLNVLFLYPKLLRLAGEGQKERAPSFFTIRVRIIRTESTTDAATGLVSQQEIPLASLYNTSPWEGPGLVDSVYTKLPRFMSEGRPSDFQTGVPMKDEIKVRLPEILDGGYSLQFTLLSVSATPPPDSDVALIPVAEYSIPLSTPASRGGSSGSRVAVVIPNGHHRLKLGDYQLHMETRLMSAIHIGDPAVASALRDFPYMNSDPADEIPETKKTQVTGAHSSVGSAPSVDQVQIDESFHTILSSASEATVLAHFDVLLHLHLCNLVKVTNNNPQSDLERGPMFMLKMAQSLFEVFRKVKVKLTTGSRAVEFGQEQLDVFIKKSIDAFDEGYLGPTPSTRVTQEPSKEQDSESVCDAIPMNPTDSLEEIFAEEPEGQDEAATRIRRQSENDKRVLKALAMGGTPFARQAFGASKTDRMRLEAELRTDNGHLAPFFDDDETVLTAPSIHDVLGNTGLLIEHVTHVTQKDSVAAPDDSENSITPPQETEERERAASGAEFAQRVRTVAQVVLAPCVGPSLSNILAAGRSSPRKAKVEQMPEPDLSTEESESHSKKQSTTICSSGSDIDDGSNDPLDSGVRQLRGPSDLPMMQLSVSSPDGEALPLSNGEYIYESIILLWLSAWVDHVEGSRAPTLDTASLSGRVIETFLVPEYDPRSAAANAVIFSFYAHMDFLLPLCLKSIALRYSVEVLPMYSPSTKAVLDDNHMMVLEPFIEVLARGLMGQCFCDWLSAVAKEQALARALRSLELVMDFVVGLLAVLHPEHMHVLLSKFLKTLRECETEHLGEDFTESDFSWTEESLHRVRCSRQMRIRIVEGLAVLPSFVALNFPLKYSGERSATANRRKTSWMNQYEDASFLAPTCGVKHQNSCVGDCAPGSGWLAELIIKEGLSVCSLSCEAVVAEAMAHIEASEVAGASAPALKKRPGTALKRGDLLMFQSLAIHAITAVYELILRRHSMDRRFQAPSARKRIAGMFACSILDKSIASVRWLARMESTHKVRSLWLLCLVYVLQEAPEAMIRGYVRAACNSKDIRIHRFIRLLRLCSSTFQSFIDLERNALRPSEIDKRMSPWLLQESFNTVCLATNIVVEDCDDLIGCSLLELTKMMQGILDLLLHVLTTPQSSVTHLRAVAGALQALEQFGVELFLHAASTNLQHWLRVILGLMNSVSLSVREVAVDFVVALLGKAFDLQGNVDTILMIFSSVLPEVVAREIALFSVSGHVSNMEDVAKALWPLRRSIADLEDANPLDDDRVDPQLSPILLLFCRACQAVIDGVLIEIRLMGDNVRIVGVGLEALDTSQTCFDADEESLFEAASFFVPETSPMQRIRWLHTLKSLHESKKQWVEAAETLVLCAKTICDSIPHLKYVWRPSRFVLWSDSRRSLWLETVGEDMGHPDRGNAQVMDFAEDFLEPNYFWEGEKASNKSPAASSGKLPQPTVVTMCTMLSTVAKEALRLYLLEGSNGDNQSHSGMEELAYARFENLQRRLIAVLEDHSRTTAGGRAIFRGSYRPRAGGAMGRSGLAGMAAAASAWKRHVEEEAALRSALASISAEMTRLAERLLLVVQGSERSASPRGFSSRLAERFMATKQPCYVAIHLTGKRPHRFLESTTIPTFLEWNTPCVCRVPDWVMKSTAPRNNQQFEDPSKLCIQFAQPYINALRKACSDGDGDSVVLRTYPPSGDASVDENEEGKTLVHVFPIDPANNSSTSLSPDYNQTAYPCAKHFFHKKETSSSPIAGAVEDGGISRSVLLVVETTVAHAFPCPLSRQRSLLTTEMIPANTKSSFSPSSKSQASLSSLPLNY